MKQEFAYFLVKILDKLDVSVALNLKFENNKIYTLKNNSIWENNNIIGIRLFDVNNDEFIIPEGKFHIERKST